MKKTCALLLLTLWLGACASGSDSAPADSTESAAPAESSPAENNDQAPAAREAVLSEFENEVSVRTNSDGEFIPAEVGFLIQKGGGLQTGENGRARLELNPEGTVVRVAPNSAFTLPQISGIDGEPKTTLSLFFGKIFVLLKGGSLDVQTPSGVASVRGSLLSVSYNPSNGRVQAACLEGHCALAKGDGGEFVLEEGDSAYLDETGDFTEFDGIDQDEIGDWLDEVPELGEFMDEIPDPENYPEFEEFEAFDFDPSAYYEETTTGEGNEYFPLDEEELPGADDFTNENEEETPPEDDSGDGGDDSGGGP